MPEGDSIWRVAQQLRPILVDAALTRFEAPRLLGPRPRIGERALSVEAVGKHLLLSFSGGVTVQVHLRMTGSWGIYRRGERWHRPAHLARLVIGVEGWEAVCYSAPVVRSSYGGGTELVGHLGPDLARDDADLAAVLRRLASLVTAEPDLAVVDALLDQRVAAGLGNVFKSEALWTARVNPTTLVRDLDADARRELFAVGQRLLRANLRPGPRVTAPHVPGGYAVYRRRGLPCPRCGAPIVRADLGATPRSTYWCPHCQPSPSPPAWLDRA